MQQVHVIIIITNKFTHFNIIDVGKLIFIELFNVINVNFPFTGEKLAFSTELIEVDYHYKRIKL